MTTTVGAPIVKDTHYRTVNRRLWFEVAFALGTVIAVSVAFGFVPELRISILSLATSWFTSGPKSAGGKTLHTVVYTLFYAMLFGMFALLAVKGRSRSKVRLFDGIYKAALVEEVKYRMGSENWSWKRRLWVQFRFGLAHFWNLIVPLNVVIGLACVGGCYLAYYLRYRKTLDQDEATMVTALIHARYNATVLVVLVGSTLIAGVGALIYSLVT